MLTKPLAHRILIWNWPKEAVEVCPFSSLLFHTSQLYFFSPLFYPGIPAATPGWPSRCWPWQSHTAEWRAWQGSRKGLHPERHHSQNERRRGGSTGWLQESCTSRQWLCPSTGELPETLSTACGCVLASHLASYTSFRYKPFLHSKSHTDTPSAQSGQV